MQTSVSDRDENNEVLRILLCEGYLPTFIEVDLNLPAS
jgi:hypothetical protein